MQRPLARALGAALVLLMAAIPAGAQDKPRHVRGEAEVSRAVDPVESLLAVELDLSSRHPGQGPALVRKEHQRHGALQVRRARQGLDWVGKKNPDY